VVPLRQLSYLLIIVMMVVPITKQYNMIPVNRRRRCATGKVTVGLESHWPCVTDFSGLTTYGFKALERTSVR